MKNKVARLTIVITVGHDDLVKIAVTGKPTDNMEYSDVLAYCADSASKCDKHPYLH